MNIPVTKELELRVFTRDNNTCQGCKGKFPTKYDLAPTKRNGKQNYLLVDHKDGASINIDNLQTLCWLCNSAKSGKSDNAFKLTMALKKLGPCVTYYPSLARIMGLKESIFLCQLLYWMPRGRHDKGNGWIYKSVEEMEFETGLTYKEQIRLRKSLMDQDLLEEEYDREQHVLYYRVKTDSLDSKAEHITNGHMPKQDMPSDKREDGICPKVISYKEAEITTEITQTNPLPPLEKQNASLEDQQPIEMDKYSAAKTLGELIGVGHSGGKGLHRLTSAIEQAQRRWPEKPIIYVIQGIASLWREYCAQGHHAPVAIHNWLDTVGSFMDSSHWRKAKKPEFIPQVDWQGGHVAADGVYVNKHGKRVPGFICPTKSKEMAGD